MDALVKTKRRVRWQRRPTGKRVTPGKYEPIWFDALYDGPLSYPYLEKFVEEFGLAETTIKHRLGDLFHEDNTPHGGPYLNRPTEQLRAIKSLHEVYENDVAAEEYMKQHGMMAPEAFHTKKTNYEHRLMVASILASLRLGCRDAGLQFIRRDEMLVRAPSGSIKVPMVLMDGGTPVKKALMSDGYFGIGYGKGSGRAFLLEADRSSEPGFSNGLDRSSYRRKLLQYEQLFSRPHSGADPLYKTHFGITSGLLVLNVFTNHRRMRNVMKLEMDESGGRGYSHMLHAVCPEFANDLAVPPVLSELLTTPWRRAGHPDIDISKP